MAEMRHLKIWQCYIVFNPFFSILSHIYIYHIVLIRPGDGKPDKIYIKKTLKRSFIILYSKLISVLSDLGTALWGIQLMQNPVSVLHLSRYHSNHITSSHQAYVDGNPPNKHISNTFSKDKNVWKFYPLLQKACVKQYFFNHYINVYVYFFFQICKPN